MNNQTLLLKINATTQRLLCYAGESIVREYIISTAKNGLGEFAGSECTPRGWHQVHAVIGLEAPIYSIWVSRVWTQEMYTPALASAHPGRDWILTRIIQLEGLEPGRNQGGNVDSLRRYIYIHGTSDEASLGQPTSHGCIRMANKDVIELANLVTIGTKIYIE